MNKNTKNKPPLNGSHQAIDVNDVYIIPQFYSIIS